MPVDPQSRALALRGLKANPLIFFRAEHDARIADPAGDLTFEELGMDSLSRMELSIWLELECGLEVTDPQIAEFGSLNGLARFLEKKLGRRP
jgi:acyl carrier protein